MGLINDWIIIDIKKSKKRDSNCVWCKLIIYRPRTTDSSYQLYQKHVNISSNCYVSIDASKQQRHISATTALMHHRPALSK